MRACLLLSLALSLLPAWVAAAPPVATARELAARVDALARSGARDDSIRRPLAIAERALREAAAARARADHEAGARDEALALAALELAEARLRLVRERALLIAAEARRHEAARELARDAAHGAEPADMPR